MSWTGVRGAVLAMLVAAAGTVAIAHPAGALPAHAPLTPGPGQVVGWGDNACAGQATPPAGLAGVVAVAAGQCHSIALKSDGTVVGWGGLSFVPGYIGSAAENPGIVPAVLASTGATGFSPVVAISAGAYHNLALRADGTVVAWGSRFYQQGTIPAGGVSGVVAIAAGLDFNVVLRNDGSLRAWGRNDFGQVSSVPTGTGFVAIAAGAQHAVAVRSSGSVVVWGDTASDQGDIPADLAAASPANPATAVTAGLTFSTALLANQATLPLVSWGSSDSGVVTPNPPSGGLPTGIGTSVKSLSAGADHELAVRSDGAVVAWGTNASGQVTGTPSIVPSPGATVATGVGAVSAGFSHSLAVGWSPPVITAQPQTPVFAASGASVRFSARAAGAPAPAVRWQSSTDGSTWTDVPGATSPELTTTAGTFPSADRFFRAVFNNGQGGDVITNPATLKVVQGTTAAAFSVPGITTTYGQGATGSISITEFGTTGPLTGSVELFLDGTQFGPLLTVSGTTASWSIPATLPAGTYTLTAKYLGDSTFAQSPLSSPITLTVQKAALTVTPNTFVAAVGTPVPPITAQATGLVNGDTLASLSGLLCGTAAPVANGLLTTAGTYAITCNGLRAENYAVTYSTAVTALITTPGFTPVTPNRLLDTRQPSGPTGGAKIQTYTLAVAGQGGVPASGAGAVNLNVTVVDPNLAGYLTVYPCDAPQVPYVSNVNFLAGQTRPNAVIVGLSAAGTLCFALDTGTTARLTAHLIVDISGWYPALAPTLRAVTPNRLFDTRQPGGGGRVQAGTTRAVQIGGLAGIPGDGSAGGVSLNVTAVDPALDGYVTAFPCGGQLPPTSSVNFRAGQVVPNAVVVPLGTGGQVCFFSSVTTDLIVDASGWFALGSPSNYKPLASPGRLFDTRSGLGGVPKRPVPAGPPAVLSYTVAGKQGLPATGMAAVVLNVTAVEPKQAGYVTVYPCGGAAPVVSSLNYVGGQVVANSVIVPVAADGSVCFLTSVASDLIADVSGYFTG